MVKAKKSPKKTVKKTISGKAKSIKSKSVSKKEEDIDLLNMDVPIKKSREEDKDTKLPETLQQISPEEDQHPSLQEVAAKDKEDKLLVPNTTIESEAMPVIENIEEPGEDKERAKENIASAEIKTEHIPAPSIPSKISEHKNEGINSYLDQMQEDDIPESEKSDIGMNQQNNPQSSESEDETVAFIQKVDNFLNKKVLGVRMGVVFAILIIFGVVAYFVYDLTNTYTANKSKNNIVPTASLEPTVVFTATPTLSPATQEVDTAESIQTLSQLRQIINLNEANTTFALITDISLLNNDNPEFFLDAQNGDWLVILTDKEIALIYRPESQKIINIERALLD